MAWLISQCIALAVTVPILHVRAAEGASEPKVRPAAVAGSFYPADPQELSKMIDAMLAKAAPPPVDGTIIAAAAPHAGYPYSGPVAAWTYAAIAAQVKAGHKYSRIVLIAPSHYVGFDFTSLYDGDAYTTPLGQVPVDKEFARRLAKMSSTMQLSDKGHQATADAPEHSVEVQLPWLQKVLGNFELVPIVMGDQSYESSRALGVALARMLRDDHDTLVLASSDLSHYHPYADAESIDHKTLHALEAYDYYSMSRNFQYRGPREPGIWEACGGAPIVATMIYAERMGANKAEVLKYANSGDITGDKSRVVGYSADVFVKSAQGADAAPPFSLTDQEKAELLTLARKSVEYMIAKSEPYAPTAPASETLNREYGAFTTLTEGGALRGCIGYTAPIKPLYMTVRDTATLAALRDPRFAPVTAAELPKLAYEISVLSPLRRVTDVEQIKVGRDGLIMKNGSYEGLLLPQVPVE
ncbi:MAG: AmmeMemoRadiSam system protein B, partial [Terracidiphilus sp.]|nr:AmmeMemoRadiSam system protein B [Terracidiphilus sp.]MDR3799930.1 AmmeMemoRadiSam system protein B [Terracidiphilus sp.]